MIFHFSHQMPHKCLREKGNRFSKNPHENLISRNETLNWIKTVQGERILEPGNLHFYFVDSIFSKINIKSMQIINTKIEINCSEAIICVVMQSFHRIHKNSDFVWTDTRNTVTRVIGKQESELVREFQIETKKKKKIIIFLRFILFTTNPMSFIRFAIFSFAFILQLSRSYGRCS